MTFGEYAKTWAETVLPLSKPATVTTVKAHLRKLIAVCDHPLDSPSTAYQLFFTALSRELAPKSVRNIYSTWHLVMTAALRQDVVSKIPVVVLPRSQRPEQDWLTLQDMRKLVSPPSNLRPLLALLAETGLRIGEALGLQTQDFKIPSWVAVTGERAGVKADKHYWGSYPPGTGEGHRELVTSGGTGSSSVGPTSISIRRSLYNGQVQTPKTLAAKRTISISKTLLATLSDNFGSKPEEFVFRSSVGKPLWPDKLGQEMHQMMRDAGIRPMGFHAWRRGNAALCAGILAMPEKVLAYRLGHEAAGLTLGRYAQFWDDMDSEWPEKIAKALFGK